MGRTAWSLIAVPAADAELFLDDTLSHGFDAIELMIPSGHADTNHPPRNARGELPFVKRLDGLAWNGALEYNRLATEAPDFTTWNEPYWASVDRLLAACEARGLLVLLFPAYVGQDQEQGWMEEITANGGARMEAYGAFVAGRYRHHRNIVWMLGGDLGKFGPRQTAAESGLLAGIESAAGPPPIHFSAEWSGDMNGVEQKPFGASMTLNSAYSWAQRDRRQPPRLRPAGDDAGVPARGALRPGRARRQQRRETVRDAAGAPVRVVGLAVDHRRLRGRQRLRLAVQDRAGKST